MGLADIAAGIEVTTKQRDRGVSTVDDTGASLAERFEEHADSLPCAPEAAATLLNAYVDGASVGDSALAAGVAPVTAAKALHRCGVVGVSPLSPIGRRVVRDWIAGRLSRSEALTLADAGETTFALAAYVETHDPVPALVEAAERARAPATNAAVAKRDALGETMSDATELR
ncbi:DUF7858 family protein [Halegenticoccus tardaugens]|uniref:DUF7858 family protein n=1 Tax=Halegenticoccus tardaugens TaxID=2071624 RepID=UPI00100B79D5|nr:hypothetical protein [Halegenticoccus tardaugens]